jgi:hypothetical protein
MFLSVGIMMFIKNACVRPNIRIHLTARAACSNHQDKWLLPPIKEALETLKREGKGAPLTVIYTM